MCVCATLLFLEVFFLFCFPFFLSFPITFFSGRPHDGLGPSRLSNGVKKILPFPQTDLLFTRARGRKKGKNCLYKCEVCSSGKTSKQQTNERTHMASSAKVKILISNILGSVGLCPSSYRTHTVSNWLWEKGKILELRRSQTCCCCFWFLVSLLSGLERLSFRSPGRKWNIHLFRDFWGLGFLLALFGEIGFSWKQLIDFHLIGWFDNSLKNSSLVNTTKLKKYYGFVTLVEMQHSWKTTND